MNQQTLALMICMSQIAVLRGHSPIGVALRASFLSFLLMVLGILTPSHPLPGNDFLPVAKLTSLPSL